MTRKNYLLFCIIIFLLLLTCPSVAYAKTPSTLPIDQKNLIDFNNLRNIEICTYDEDGNSDALKVFEQQRTQLRLTVDDGCTTVSNKNDISKLQNDFYPVYKNELIRRTSYPIWNPGPEVFIILSDLFVLLVPFGLTVYLEWKITHIFKIQPAKYVCIINLITNPIMNIILIIVMANIAISYLLLVLILELVVLCVEYIFYLYKYKNIDKLKLLKFTATANAVSWSLYALFNFNFSLL